jgi:hypothetical protein
VAEKKAPAAKETPAVASWAAHAAPSTQRTTSGSIVQSEQPQPTPAEAAQQLQQQKGAGVGAQQSQSKEREKESTQDSSVPKDTPAAAPPAPAPSSTPAVPVPVVSQPAAEVGAIVDSSFPPLGATVQPSVQSGMPPRHSQSAQQPSWQPAVSPATTHPQPAPSTGASAAQGQGQPSPKLAPQVSPMSAGGIMPAGNPPPAAMPRAQLGANTAPPGAPDLQVEYFSGCCIF